MKIGIIGLPNVGKSTLFKALTKKEVDIQNYPFCTIEPNVGVVAVPDERLDVLTKISKSKKTIPAIVEFFDIAGLVAGASAGEGLGNKFLSHIRETDAILHIVRVFLDENIIHVGGAPNPAQDIETINLELVLADLETVAKRLEKSQKDAKRGDKQAITESQTLERLKQWLEEGKLASSFRANEKEKEIIGALHLISSKPVIYVLNQKTGGKNLDIPERLEGAAIIIDSNLEMELSEFSKEEAEEYKKSAGVNPRTKNFADLIRLGYRTLGLITFFTTGEDESRAWTIKNGSTAPEAGRAIHSDFQEKFIKAEVTSFDDFVKKTPPGRGKIVGKDYIVQDGDIIEFKI